MADYDLTLRIAPNLDCHLVLPLLDFLQERQFYPDEQILKAKIELLNETNMVDYAMDIHKSLYHTEDVPQDMVDRRAEVVSRLKALEESAAPLVAFLQNPAAVQELADKQYNLQMLDERYQIGPDQIEALYQYAKFQFECGNYSGAADYLYQYRVLCTNSDRSLSALWGKLAAEVLMQNWDIALEELNRLKEIIDSKNFSSPMNQVQSRIWLMHWSLFIFFNHDNGRTQIIDLFNQDKYLNAIQTNAPHLLRYLATAFIVNKRRRPQFKDFIKVIQQEQHSYKDPITEFLTCVYINYDFDGAQKKMRECEELILNDPFLGKRLKEGNLSSVPLRDEFLENARLFIFETYCRIHQRIDVSILAEKLNLNYEEAERWIVNLVRTSKLDAKIDSKTGTVIMEPNHPNVYEQLIDHTKALSGHTYKMSKNRAIIDGKDKHTKAIWDDVTLDVFNEKTGRDYDYKQLKNKWTALRKDWQVWNALIGADTGLGWGPLRQTIDATNQWWEDKLKLVPEAFRVKGLQKVDQLDILFKDAAVTGVGAWAPSQGLLQINDNEEGNNNDTVGDTEFDDNDFNNMESATNDVDASEAASKLSEKLDRMCEVIENRRKDSPGCSILEVMNALKGLPGIVEGDELYMKAADIFVKREYREIFAAIGKPQIQVAWLKQKKL